MSHVIQLVAVPKNFKRKFYFISISYYKLEKIRDALSLKLKKEDNKNEELIL